MGSYSSSTFGGNLKCKISATDVQISSAKAALISAVHQIITQRIA